MVVARRSRCRPEGEVCGGVCTGGEEWQRMGAVIEVVREGTHRSREGWNMRKVEQEAACEGC